MRDPSRPQRSAFAFAATLLVASMLSACSGKTADAAVIHLNVDTSGAMTWNGEAVSNEQLKAKLDQAVQANPRPHLDIQTAKDAPYAKTSEIFSILKPYDIPTGITGGT